MWGNGTNPNRATKRKIRCGIRPPESNGGTPISYFPPPDHPGG